MRPLPEDVADPATQSGEGHAEEALDKVAPRSPFLFSKFNMLQVYNSLQLPLAHSLGVQGIWGRRADRLIREKCFAFHLRELAKRPLFRAHFTSTL